MCNTTCVKYLRISLGLAVSIIAFAITPSAFAGGASTALGGALGDPENRAAIIDAMLDMVKAAGKGTADLGKDELSPPDDGQAEPDYDRPGMPKLPAMCKGDSRCDECFQQPNKQLNSLRFRFEKLRKVNLVTKNMIKESIEFGDAMADLAGGLTPLAWHNEVMNIHQSEANFNQKYDTKYKELTSTLLATLKAISECEWQVFGEPGWYERYGFVYYQYMSDAYRLPN